MLGTQQPTPTAAKPDPRERLDTAIAEAIRLLEGKEHVKFLTTFSEPGRLAQRRDTIEEFAAKFAKETAERLLVVLRQIQATKPAISPDGMIATFTPQPPPDSGPRTLRWAKVGKLWFIDN